MRILLCLLLVTVSTQLRAQSWLDVFNRYRVAQAADWLAPIKIPRSDLRPFVTLARRSQACSDCRVETLGDTGRFALAMQGQGTRKDIEAVRTPKGETLLTARDMEFLRAHAWDGAGKVFIGSTTHTPSVSPQSLVMGLVSQIGVRGHPIAIGFGNEDEDRLLWGYRLLPISASDVLEPIVRDGRLVYPVILKFNLYFHEPVEDVSLSPYDFQSGKDISFPSKIRLGKSTSGLTLKAEFTFDQPVVISQNGYQAQGNGRLLDAGKWLEQSPIKHLWVATPYGSSASEHPALSPKALNLIQDGRWNAPELTKRLTTFVSLKNVYEAFPWLEGVNLESFKDDQDGIRILIAKKIENAFYRNKIPVKLWSESIYIPRTNQELMSLRITFYGNYDQSKVLRIFERLGMKVDMSDAIN